MNQRAFTAVCRRSGDWWDIEVPEVPGVFTQARRLDQAEGMVREALALMLDVGQDSFDVALRIGDRQLADSIAEVTTARSEAEQAAERAAVRTRQVLAKLVHDQHLTLRDAAKLVGMSHQRVAQVLAGLPEARTSDAVRPRRRAPRKSA